MKKQIVAMVSAAALCSLLVGCTPQTFPAGSLHVLGMPENGTTVTAAVNDRIILLLPVDANADYPWDWTAGDTTILASLGERPRAQVGRPGVYVVTLIVSRSGSTPLTFEYRQDGNGAATSTFSVTVQATP